MPVFPAIFERVAGNLLSVDGSATQLPAILLGVDAPLDEDTYLYPFLIHVLFCGINCQLNYAQIILLLCLKKIVKIIFY